VASTLYSCTCDYILNGKLDKQAPSNSLLSASLLQQISFLDRSDLSEGCTDLQSLITCLDHAGIVAQQLFF